MSFKRSSLPWAMAAFSAVLISLVIMFPHSNDTAPLANSNICGRQDPPPLKYDHIIWILEENRALGSVIGSAAAPFITTLASQCAYSTNFLDNEPRQNLGGPGFHSLSHYLADTSGSNCAQGNGRTGTGCVYNDRRLPIGYALSGESIFQQIELLGGTWKSYQESAPHNCSATSSGKYVYRHDAAVYYTAIQDSCLTHDIPIPSLDDEPTGALINDINHNQLPTFAYVTPNIEHDMHDGSVAQGDAWLQAYLEPLFDSQTWAEGRTAVFVIWDEAPLSSQTLPNLVIAPTAHGGAMTVTANGFAILRATEQMLTLPLLGCATGNPPGNVGSCYPGATANLRAAFNI